MAHNSATSVSVTLTRKQRADLDAYCQATGETPAAVLADAVALHLDTLSTAWRSIALDESFAAEAVS